MYIYIYMDGYVYVHVEGVVDRRGQEGQPALIHTKLFCRSQPPPECRFAEVNSPTNPSIYPLLLLI